MQMQPISVYRNSTPQRASSLAVRFGNQSLSEQDMLNFRTMAAKPAGCGQTMADVLVNLHQGGRTTVSQISPGTGGYLDQEMDSLVRGGFVTRDHVGDTVGLTEKGRQALEKVRPGQGGQGQGFTYPAAPGPDDPSDWRNW